MRTFIKATAKLVMIVLTALSMTLTVYAENSDSAAISEQSLSNKLQDAGSAALDWAKEKAPEVKDKASEIWESAKDKAPEVKDKAVEVWGDVKDKASEAVDDFKIWNQKQEEEFWDRTNKQLNPNNSPDSSLDQGDSDDTSGTDGVEFNPPVITEAPLEETMISGDESEPCELSQDKNAVQENIDASNETSDTMEATETTRANNERGSTFIPIFLPILMIGMLALILLVVLVDHYFLTKTPRR